MQLLKRIFDFYIYSNIHVALAGFCITKITLIKFGNVESYTPYFVALSILVSYNFIRYYEIKTSHLTWFKSWFFEPQVSWGLMNIVSGENSYFPPNLRNRTLSLLIGKYF